MTLLGAAAFLVELLTGDLDADTAQAIATSAAAVLTVLALFAAYEAMTISERHFDIEQRPLLSNVRPHDQDETALRAVPMAPHPVRVAPAAMYVGTIPGDIVASGVEQLALSFPYRNIGKGVARVTGVRLRARETLGVDQPVYQRDIEHVVIAGESDARTWLNVKRSPATEWLFEAEARTDEQPPHQAAQVRFDIELLYTDIQGRSPQITALLARPRTASSYGVQGGDAGRWYVEAARFFETDADIEAYNERLRTGAA